MKRALVIVCLFSILVCTAHAQAAPASDIDGSWLGTLSPGQIKLRVVFHIKTNGNALTATLDSIDQGAKGIPVTSVSRNVDSVKMEVSSIVGVFEGKLDKDLATITGTWTQGGVPLPLTLKRVNGLAELKVRHPQEPAKPYPYSEQEVEYENASAGIKLAGTLTLPQGKGPFPAVILITGSGPQDRDESIFGHRPFLVLADSLTRRGIAVLRADDRGFAKSTGSFATATTADFATDVEAGVAYLKTRPEINAHKIGLVGHSEGAVIAPMVAARNKDVAFIVMLAGSGVSGDEIIAEQSARIAEASGASREQLEAVRASQREVLLLVKNEKDGAALEKKFLEKLSGKASEEFLKNQLKIMTTPWYRYFINYDPTLALRKLTCPVLALTGTKDTQVPSQQNLPAIRSALLAAGNKNFEVEELAGLNHLFQTATTGAPAEYGQIEETFAPVALQKIGNWIAAR